MPIVKREGSCFIPGACAPYQLLFSRNCLFTASKFCITRHILSIIGTIAQKHNRQGIKHTILDKKMQNISEDISSFFYENSDVQFSYTITKPNTLLFNDFESWK